MHAGRCMSVDPGEGNILCITSVSFNDEHRRDNELLYDDLHAPECEVFLGINSTRREFPIGYLNTLTRPQLDFRLPMVLSEKFTLGHSAYSTIRFSGYRYAHQPQPQLQPLPMDQGCPFDSQIITKVISILIYSFVFFYSSYS